MKKNLFWSKAARRFVDRRTVLAGAAAVGAASSLKINPIGFAKAAGHGEVTFYTSMPQKYSNLAVEAFNKTKGKEAGITAKVFYAAGFKTYQRAVAEYTAGRCQHDVIMLSDASLFLDMERDGQLYGYTSPETKHFPKSHQASDGIWCNGRTLVMMYSYNTNMAGSGGAAFKKWADFPGSEFGKPGRFGVSNPMGGGTALINYIATREHKDLGIEWWREVAKMKPQVETAHGKLTRLCLAGKLGVTINLDYNVWNAKYKDNAPIEPVFPEEVVAVPIIPLSLVKQAPNPEGGKVFVDWWLSKAGQEAVRDANAIYSPRADVAPLKGQPPFSSMNALTPDVKHVQEVRKQYQAEYKEMFNL